MRKTTNLVWGGRFKKESSDLLKKINNSIKFDYQLAYQDVQLSKSYAKSLLECKILSATEFKKIFNALNIILDEIQNGKFKFSDSHEDIHMNIEMALKEKVGRLAGKIHTGKSRNDQVATDLKLWIKDKLKDVILKLKKIQKLF